MHIAVREATRNSVFALLLVALYILSFSIPFFFAFKFGDWGLTGTSQVFDEDSLFGEVTSITASGNYLSVATKDALAPAQDKDFLFSVWIRPTRLPQKSEKILFSATSNFASESQSGFAIGLSRDEQKIRPIVFWGNGKVGRWFSFSEVELYPLSWVLFALSYTESRFLGLHVVNFSREGAPQVQLLGGYDVPMEDFTAPASPLILGAIGSGKFRGRVGPFGVISSTELAEKLPEIVKDLAKAPLERPRSIALRDVQLWAPSSRNDISGGSAQIELVSPSLRSAQSGPGSK